MRTDKIAEVLTGADWATVSGVTNVAMALIVLASVIILMKQLWELQRATNAQVFANALDQLQSEEIRTARRNLFKLKEKPIGEWTDDERHDAEKVCSTYNTVALMARLGMLPEPILAKYWRNSILRSWEAAKPLVGLYRDQIGAREFWGSFEWLAKRAAKQKSDY